MYLYHYSVENKEQTLLLTIEVKYVFTGTRQEPELTVISERVSEITDVDNNELIDNFSKEELDKLLEENKKQWDVLEGELYEHSEKYFNFQG